MPLPLKNVKDGEICPCAKFRLNVIIVARNIANKHFSLKKAPDPGLKLNTLRISNLARVFAGCSKDVWPGL